MVRIICGEKGKGKTKHLLDKVNEHVKSAQGTIVYLDKSTKHMYELSNKIRLVNVKEYPLFSANAFIGFVCGILSQDWDLEAIYFDSFLTIANLEEGDITGTIDVLEKLSEKYHVDFILSVSRDAHDLPENAKKDIEIAL